MVWKVVNISNPGTSTKFGADDTDKINKLFSGVDVDDVDINADWLFRSSRLRLGDSDNSHYYLIIGGNLTANRNITYPVLTGNDVPVFEAHTQTLSNKTLDATCTVSSSFSDQTEYDYIIFKSGSNTVAYNTATRVNQYSSSDARTTFKNVADALNSASGGSVLVRKGTYTMISADDYISIYDNQNWVGEDRDLTILVNESTTQACWKRITTPPVKFKMSNMTIKSDGDGNMIYSSGSTDCTFENMYFYYVSAPASPSIMTFFDSVSGTIDNTRLRIYHCKYEGDANTEDMLGLGNCINCDFSHNMFLNSTGQGIGTNTTVGSKYNDNFFYKIGTNSIGFELTCSDNEICNNVCISCGGQIKLSELATANNKSINNLCSNNIIAYSVGGGIEDGWGEGDIITNNVIRRTGTYGIGGTLSRSIITGNVFYETNYTQSTTDSVNTCGINLTNNSNFTTPGQVIIDNNYFYTARSNFTIPSAYTNGGQTKQGYLGGIYVGSNNTNVNIGKGNIFDNVWGNITDKGVQTIQFMDRTITELIDEFPAGSISNTNTSNSIGVLGWGTSAAGTSAPVVTAGVANHPGIISLVTGSTSGNNNRLHLTDAANTAFLIPTDLERFAWIVRIPTITSVSVRVGIGQDLSSTTFGTAGAWFQFDSAVDADNWQVITRQASTSTTTTITGVTVDANDWFLLEALLSEGNWEFYINNANKTTHSANQPTTACNVGAMVQTATTAARQLDIDWFKIKTKKLGQRWT